MAAKLIYDINHIDLNNVIIPVEEIRKVNSQRFEMEQLSGIFMLDKENSTIIGYKDIRSDEFWVRGHIPGRPIFPGILIIEAAAQLCTYFYKITLNDNPARFLGFGGIDRVKFRGTVHIGDRLILIAKNTELKTRRATFDTQGIVNGKVVFEGVIIGMPV